jgi:hypothetical protein
MSQSVSGSPGPDQYLEKAGNRELARMLQAGQAAKQPLTEQALTAPLYEEMGRLKMELDWLKKSRLSSVENKRVPIEPHHPDLSVVRQCALIGLSRSSYYHTSCGIESERNLRYMRLIDEQYPDNRAPQHSMPANDENFHKTTVIPTSLNVSQAYCIYTKNLLEKYAL